MIADLGTKLSVRRRFNQKGARKKKGREVGPGAVGKNDDQKEEGPP